jgi:dolichol kinase
LTKTVLDKNSFSSLLFCSLWGFILFYLWQPTRQAKMENKTAVASKVVISLAFSPIYYELLQLLQRELADVEGTLFFMLSWAVWGLLLYLLWQPGLPFLKQKT